MRVSTRDEQDERMIHPNSAESSLSKELEREDAHKRAIARDVAAKPKVPKVKPPKPNIRIWRVRATVMLPSNFTAEMVKAHIAGHLQSSSGTVTRVREVLG